MVTGSFYSLFFFWGSSITFVQMKFFLHKQFKKIKKIIDMNATEIFSRLDALDAAITVEKQQFIDTIVAKDAIIADLQNQLANVITPADGDAIGARVDAATTEVGNIVP
jgi:Zn-dependent M16 (insulinase) family peptidase